MSPELIGSPHISPRSRWVRLWSILAAAAAAVPSRGSAFHAPAPSMGVMAKTFPFVLFLLDGMVAKVHQPIRETVGLSTGWGGAARRDRVQEREIVYASPVLTGEVVPINPLTQTGRTACTTFSSSLDTCLKCCQPRAESRHDLTSMRTCM